MKHTRLLYPCQVSDREPLPDSEYCSAEQEDKLRRIVPAKSEHDKWGDIYRILFPKQSEYEIPDPCKSNLQPNIYGELTQIDYSEPIARTATDIHQILTHLVDARFAAILKTGSKLNESAATSPSVIELIDSEVDTHTAHLGNAAQSHNGDSLVVRPSRSQDHPVSDLHSTSQNTVLQSPYLASPSPIHTGYRHRHADMKDQWITVSDTMSNHPPQPPRNYSGNNPFAQRISSSPTQTMSGRHPDCIVSTEYVHSAQHVPNHSPSSFTQTTMNVGAKMFGECSTSRPSHTPSHATTPSLENMTTTTDQFSMVAPTQHAPVDFQSPYSPTPLPFSPPLAQLFSPVDIVPHELLNSQDIWSCKNPFRRSNTSQQVSAKSLTSEFDWDADISHVYQDTTGM
jgi:hypothetical protein